MSERHLLVTNDFPPKVGGIQAYLWELWRRLDPDRYAVLTARSHPDALGFDEIQAGAGIRIERVQASTLYLPTPRARAHVRSAVRASDASLVIFDPVLPLGLLGPALGMPYGVVLHGAEVAIPSRVPGAAALLDRVLAGASLVVSAGSYPARVAQRSLCRVDRTGAAPHRVHVEVPPGVDCGHIVPLEAAARRAARARLGLPGDGPLIASVSRLVPRKGMDVLVEAVCRIAPSFPDLSLAIAGTGREHGRLAAQVRRSGAPVRLLGSVSEEDKAALLGAADVFAMACRDRWGGLEQEGFGIVFLEAAAAGIPQVAGASGGAPDAVDDDVTGYVVRRPERPGEVAEALRRLVADDGTRHTMGSAARARACTQFSHDVLAKRLAAALDEVQG